MTTIAGLILRKRALVVGLLAVASCLALPGLLRLGFDFSPQDFFQTGDDDNDYLDRMAETFGRTDNLIMLIVRRPEGVLEPGTLAYVDRLTRRVRRAEWADRVEGITTIKVVIPPKSELDDLRVEALGAAIDEAAIAGDPLIDGQLINPRRTATAIFVEIDQALDRVDDYRPVVADLKATLADTPPPAGVSVQLYGLPHLRLWVVDLLARDQRLRLPIMGGLFALVLFVLFRRPVAVFGPIAAVLMAMGWVGGVMGWIGQPFDLLTNILPMLLFAIGMSDSIHLLARYVEECERHPGDQALALQITVRRLAAACFLTSFTTAVGFGSLVVARTEILARFAVLATAGVLFAYLTTILLLPALLSWVGPLRRPTRRRPHSPRRLLAALLEGLGRAITTHPIRCLGAAAIFAALMGFGMTRVVVDSHVHEAFRKRSDLYKQQMAAQEALGGLFTVVLSLETDRPEGLRDPKVLRRIWALQRYLESEPGTGRTISPATYVRALWIAFQGLQPPGDDPLATPNLPSTRAELAQILLMGSLGGDALPWDRVVTEDWRRLRVQARIEDYGTRYFLPMFDRIKARAAQLFADTPWVQVRLTGEGYVAAAALHYFIYDLLKSLAVAAVIIFGAMTLLFRSVRLGLVSVIPNLFPLACTFGFMGLAGINLNVSTILTFAISLGLAVDDTIHFLVRYNEERARHPNRQAVLETIRHAAVPVVMTSALLVLGISVLLTSEFLATFQFALLLLVAIVAALPGDLIILPALLVLFGEGADLRGARGRR